MTNSFAYFVNYLVSLRLASRSVLQCKYIFHPSYSNSDVYYFTGVGCWLLRAIIPVQMICRSQIFAHLDKVLSISLGIHELSEDSIVFHRVAFRTRRRFDLPSSGFPLDVAYRRLIAT